MNTKTLLLALEFAALFIALPAYIIIERMAPFMFAFLWAGTLYAWLILRFKYHDHLKALWKWSAVTADNLKPILIRWAICCVFMTAFIWIYDPDRMFGLFIRNPYFIPVLLLLYPVLSALPQEFIFCSFFFKRYEAFLKTPRLKIIASAATFAFAHMLYINPVAPLISFIGGLIFADTYNRHRSLALVTIEHGLYGNFLFILGLGWYFYGGAVAEMQAIPAP